MSVAKLSLGDCLVPPCMSMFPCLDRPAGVSDCSPMLGDHSRQGVDANGQAGHWEFGALSGRLGATEWHETECRGQPRTPLVAQKAEGDNPGSSSSRMALDAHWLASKALASAPGSPARAPGGHSCGAGPRGSARAARACVASICQQRPGPGVPRREFAFKI